MDFPEDFESLGLWVPMTKRSPVSSSNLVGSGVVLDGRSGRPGNSWDSDSWHQATTAALVSTSQQGQICSSNDREMPMSFSSLLALSDPVITTDMTYFEKLMLTEIGSSPSGSQMMPETSASQNHFLLNSDQISTNQNHFLLHRNGNSVPTSSDSNINNWPLVPQSQYVLPTLVPNINSVPEINVKNTFFSNPGVSPVTPARLVQNKKMCRAIEIIDLVDDDTPASQNMQMNGFGTFQQSREEEPQLTFSTPGVPSRIVSLQQRIMSLQQQEGEMNAMSSAAELSLQQADGENQGIDLNKTPQQKPKRKKHRPKVIREGKPAKRPKPVTPKPATPRRARMTENLPEGKRKYVRKKKDVASKENPSDELGDTITPQSGNGSKSVRRTLNFASEDYQARDVRPGLEMMSTHNADYHASIASSSSKSDMKSVQGRDLRSLENPQAAIASSSPKSLMQSVQEWESRLLENSQAAIASSTAQYDMHSGVHSSRALENPLSDRILLDLNSSVDQFNDECLMILQTQNLPPQPSRQGGMRESQLQDEYRRMIDNMVLPPQPGRREGENLKKKRTENIHNEGPTAYPTFICTSNGWETVPVAQSTSNALTFADTDAETVVTYKKFRALEHMLPFNQDKRTANNRPVEDQSPPSVSAGFANQMASTPLRPPHHSSEGSQPSTPEKPSERTANNRSLHHQSPPSVNAVVGNRRASTPLKLPGNSAGCQPSTPEKPSGSTCNPGRTPSSLNAGVCNQRTSTLVNLLGHNNAGCQPSTPEKPSGSTYRPGIMGIGPQARIETAVAASNRLKLRDRRARKKERVPLITMSLNAKQLGMENEAASTTTDASYRQESLGRNISVQSTSRKNSRLGRNSVQDFQHTSSYKGSVSRSSQLWAVMPYQDPVDEIVQKLRHLNICEGYKNVSARERNALVPYVGRGVGTMVAYGGKKKRRPRPKVDLDPESDRVWKLLMGKECDEGDREMGADKEKWWEEERRVFRGRADSFIARMHLVQGDRRFSKWKGSVVDSVIGVFLTQNVSDHLSSSAYMSLAARFPARSSGNNCTANVDKIDRPMPSVVIHETEQVDEKKMENCHESPESNTGSSILDYLDGDNLNCHDRELGIGRESPDCGSATPVTVTSGTSGVEGEDRSLLEDVVSSKNFVVSSQNSSEYLVEAADPGKVNSLLNFDDDLLYGGMGNSFSSFTELLRMASSSGLHEMSDPGNGRTSCLELNAGINQLKNIGMNQMPSLPTPSDDLSAGPSTYKTNSHSQLTQSDFISLSRTPSLSCNYQNSVTSKFAGLQYAGVLEKGKHDNVSPDASPINKTNRIELMHKQCCPSAENSTKDMEQQALLVSRVASVDTYAPITKSCMHCIGSEIHLEMNSSSQNNLIKAATQASSNGTSSSGLSLLGENIISLQQREREATSQADSCQREVEAPDPYQIRNFVTPPTCSAGHNSNNQENTSEVITVKPNLANGASFSLVEASKNSPKAKKVKSETDKNNSFDWDSLRKQTCLNGVKKERNSEAMDSLDYEALRSADVNVISYTIRERGMNNLLADRIKEFLNRLVRDHGSMDLEWLRDVPPEKAKDYLLSIRGLGLKSVECVRLLTLHHLAFPVDTNVGRIAVRLGWVPLQPLPESLQLHLLEMYPVMETIQKYLWPRLCKLDQRTLYELHYQLITFGKVFCTKSKPNCNACPMRGECRHFASAFASARLALPGPEEKRLVSLRTPNFPEVNHVPIFKSVPHPQLEGCIHTQDHTVHRNCEPIIEEPASPEPECMETLESAIEDAFFDDPDEIPTIKLNMEEFTQNLQSYIERNNMELQDGDMSKALIALTPDVASIPMPKLKNVSRLRTEHQVYELPDSHPLLEGMDRRERDDPSPYLLAIWTPGETAQSTEPSKVSCNSHDTGNLCKENTCFSCNSIREANAQVVRGTILIPCRTAMRGSFPLNGTYFQVNEVFADHDSSRKPIDVPTNWIWNLPKRTVYFGTSVPTIFKGLTTEGIQQCFWRGFVCVRGFDRTSRRPRPLYARLHLPATKSTKDKRAAETSKE